MWQKFLIAVCIRTRDIGLQSWERFFAGGGGWSGIRFGCSLPAASVLSFAYFELFDICPSAEMLGTLLKIICHYANTFRTRKTQNPMLKAKCLLQHLTDLCPYDFSHPAEVSWRVLRWRRLFHHRLPVEWRQKTVPEPSSAAGGDSNLLLPVHKVSGDEFLSESLDFDKKLRTYFKDKVK